MANILENANICTYKWKNPPIIDEDRNIDDSTQIGLIAEELNELDSRFVYCDEKTGEPETVHYQMLTLPLIAGWRAHKVEINELRAENRLLKTRLDEMNERLTKLEGGTTTTRKRKTT